MYLIKDLVYSNRWVEVGGGEVIKFNNSLAEVKDKDINLFKGDLEFQILEQISVDMELTDNEKAEVESFDEPKPVKIEINEEYEKKPLKKK